MKTQTTATVFNTSKRVTRLHWLVSILGVVTAIICSLVLMKDLRPARGERSFTNMNTSVDYKLVSLKDIAVYSIKTGLSELKD